ncbi:MAG: hypothetical protein ACD_7C00511G0006 [uncultured bacterium]|nr:MAG: hypothetical protein ACD_7C00511G0006 [uncultured bacterium]KKP68312.1 MAG: hypothetical protein UR66_C0006G0013 [Candidatus Moranbacteria bacterium GW2011_GWE1_35_17]KKP70643.1 MAG: hypothetical protein UR65_C0039G0007 [Candidatus Moranbacteria bacterium GW2011_GWE2_35_164]KKP81844.1 MAG: hypothetical protein UR82_C0050G0003 [Candidatus Moranbacteria bacterium GW2011_GWF1_35_5]KKP82782.1 MAG: hypothetical protein UR83_C0045G0005 [Candidatus Moranbacteria bacterium GW2011_GWF2_35_54]HB
MLELSITQIAISLFATLFIVNSIFKFTARKRGQTVFRLFFNLTIWSVILFFALSPEIAHSLSQKLGFGDNLNTFIFIGFVVVFVVLFKIINILDRIERNVSEIVRKEALEKIANLKINS